MNHSTIKKLKSNPHYKMSAAQKAAMEDDEGNHMVEFGVPRIHNDHVEKHDVVVHKRRRASAKKPSVV